MLRIPAEEDRQEEREPEGGGHVFPAHLPKVLYSFFFLLQYCGFQSGVTSNSATSVQFMEEFTGFSQR